MLLLMDSSRTLFKKFFGGANNNTVKADTFNPPKFSFSNKDQLMKGKIQIDPTEPAEPIEVVDEIPDEIFDDYFNDNQQYEQVALDKIEEEPVEVIAPEPRPSLHQPQPCQPTSDPNRLILQLTAFAEQLDQMKFTLSERQSTMDLSLLAFDEKIGKSGRGMKGYLLFMGFLL